MENKVDLLNKKYFVLILFTVIAFSIFSSSINSSFHFDDLANIKYNKKIKMDELSLTSLKTAASSTHNHSFRPVPNVTFALNYYISGLDTTSYHVVNILIHSVNAFLIYIIILSLFYGADTDEERDRVVYSAFFTALFWLVTPFNSQSVIYIVQRMTSMMTLFFLLSFLFYVKAKKDGKKAYYILSGIFFLLSFFSKQNALIFPLVIILYEFIFVREGDIKKVSGKEKTAIIILLVILFLPLIFFWERIRIMFTSIHPDWELAYYKRMLTQFRVIVRYLTLIVLPVPGRLSISHDIVESTSLFAPVTTFFSVIIVAALFAFSIIRMKKSPYLSFAILWFFITMSVEAVLPIDQMFEHRMYLPSIFILGAGMDYVTKKFFSRNKMYLISSLCVIALILCAITGIRGLTWENEFTLWTDTVKKYPYDARAQANLGAAYKEMGVYDKAEYHLTLAVDMWKEFAPIKENVAHAYHNLGEVYEKLGKPDLAKSSYIMSIAYADNWFQPFMKLGIIFFQDRDYKEALKYFKQAAEVAPEEADCHLNLGSAYYLLKEYENAIKSYKEVIKLNNGNSSAYNAIGAVYRDMGNYENALQYFKKAVYYDSGNKRARENVKYVERLIREAKNGKK